MNNTEVLDHSKMCYAYQNFYGSDILLYGEILVKSKIIGNGYSFIANNLRPIKGIMVRDFGIFELIKEICDKKNKIQEKHAKDPNFINNDVYICFYTKEELENYYFGPKSISQLSSGLSKENTSIVKKLLQELQH